MVLIEASYLYPFIRWTDIVLNDSMFDYFVLIYNKLLK